MAELHNALGEALASSEVKIAAGTVWTGTTGNLLGGFSASDMTHVRMICASDLCGFETISANNRIEMLPIMGRE